MSRIAGFHIRLPQLFKHRAVLSIVGWPNISQTSIKTFSLCS
jgi:hypothetical protein